MTAWNVIFIYLLCGTISALTMYALGVLENAIAWVYEQQKNHKTLGDSEVRLLSEFFVVVAHAVFWPISIAKLITRT